MIEAKLALIVLEIVESVVNVIFALSPFIFHLGLVHLLQNVALHQCLPLSSVVFNVSGGSLFLCYVILHFLLNPPLDFFPLLACHSAQRLVHLLSCIPAICVAHFYFCFSVYSIMTVIFVLLLICEHGALSCSFIFNIFSLHCCLSSFWFVCQLFIKRPCLSAIGQC